MPAAAIAAAAASAASRSGLNLISTMELSLGVLPRGPPPSLLPLPLPLPLGAQGLGDGPGLPPPLCQTSPSGPFQYPRPKPGIVYVGRPRVPPRG